MKFNEESTRVMELKREIDAIRAERKGFLARKRAAEDAAIVISASISKVIDDSNKCHEERLFPAKKCTSDYEGR